MFMMASDFENVDDPKQFMCSQFGHGDVEPFYFGLVYSACVSVK